MSSTRPGTGCLAAALLLLAPPAIPCSSFLISRPAGNFLGRNFDFPAAKTFLIANRRGLRKQALVGPPNIPARWTSKYGSVTLNMIARELPVGGMNEKGLAVEGLWLRSAKFPAPDQRPAVGELQWLQYQLDNYATVDEVSANLKTINVISRVAPIHYFVCDAGGACATIEALGGKLVVHRGRSLPVRALTNDPYADSVEYRGEADSRRSLARFARVKAALAGDKPSNEPIAASFGYLSSVASPVSDADDDQTLWSVVYELGVRVAHFKTAGDQVDRRVSLSELDFDCAPSAKAISVDTLENGDVTAKLADFTPEMNRAMVEASLGERGFAHLPPESLKKLSGYPASTVCAPSAPSADRR